MEQKNVKVVETNNRVVVAGNDSEDGVFVSDGDKNVRASMKSGDDYIETGNGDDFISTGTGNDTAITGGGDDRIFEYIPPNKTLEIDPDNNTEVDRFSTGSGNDSVRLLDGGTNYVDTGSDNDSITIKHGTNHVKMGTGRDELTVGRKGTYFVDMGSDEDLDQLNFSTRDKIDATVTNFNVKHDALNINGFDGVDEFKEHAKQVGDDVVFEYRNSKVVLKDVSLSEMTDKNLSPIEIKEGKKKIKIKGTDEDDTFEDNGSKSVNANLKDGNDSIVTGSGDDKIKTGKGSDTAVTGAGDDTIIERKQGRPEKNNDVDRFNTEAGDDVVKLKDGGTNYVDAGTGNDTVKIQYGINHVNLGQGEDELKARDGTFFVDLGNDTDSDTFQFSKNDEVDLTVTNFNIEHDVIDITGVRGLDQFTEDARQVGDDVLYQHDDASLLLKNVDLSTMTDDNFG